MKKNILFLGLLLSGFISNAIFAEGKSWLYQEEQDKVEEISKEEISKEEVVPSLTEKEIESEKELLPLDKEIESEKELLPLDKGMFQKNEATLTNNTKHNIKVQLNFVGDTLRFITNGDGQGIYNLKVGESVQYIALNELKKSEKLMIRVYHNGTNFPENKKAEGTAVEASEFESKMQNQNPKILFDIFTIKTNKPNIKIYYKNGMIHSTMKK